MTRRVDKKITSIPSLKIRLEATCEEVISLVSKKHYYLKSKGKAIWVNDSLLPSTGCFRHMVEMPHVYFGKCVSIYWTIAAVTVLSSTRQITALGYETTNKTVSLKVIEHSSLVLSVYGAKWNCIFLLKWIIPEPYLTFAKKQYTEQRLGTGNQTCTDSAGRPL